MMKKKFADLADSILEKIDDSNADEFKKVQMRDIIENARMQTDPTISADERLRLMAENQFSICSIICLLMIDQTGSSKETWQNLVYKARWAIVVAMVLLSAIFSAHTDALGMIINLFTGK